jgi:hypothetical protein
MMHKKIALVVAFGILAVAGIDTASARKTTSADIEKISNKKYKCLLAASQIGKQVITPRTKEWAYIYINNGVLNFNKDSYNSNLKFSKIFENDYSYNFMYMKQISPTYGEGVIFVIMNDKKMALQIRHNTIANGEMVSEVYNCMNG